MPYMHCVDCEMRAFKNFDVPDTDDEDNYFCATCEKDTQWMSETQFADRRRRRRSSDQPLLHLGNGQPQRDQAPQRSEQDTKDPSSPDTGKRTLKDDDGDDEREERPSLATQVQPRKVSLATPTSRPRRASVQSQGSSALPEDTLIELLLQEVPTLGTYVRRLREEVQALRRDKVFSADQLTFWQRQVGDLEADKATLAQDSEVLIALNGRLREENQQLQDSLAALERQVQATGPRGVGPASSGTSGSRPDILIQPPSKAYIRSGA